MEILSFLRKVTGVGRVSPQEELLSEAKASLEKTSLALEAQVELYEQAHADNVHQLGLGLRSAAKG